MAAAAPDDEEEAKHRYQADRLMFQLDQWMSSRKERLQDAFHAFDSDGNGTLDFGEVCKMADRLQITASVPEVRILFDSIDVDGSGSISLVKLDHHLRKWRQSAGDHRQEAPVTPPRSLGAWKRQTVETVGEVFAWTPSEVAKQRAVTKAVAVTTFNEAGRKRSREVAKENRVAALMAGMGDSIKKEGKIKEDQEEEAALQQKLRSQLLGNAAVKGWAIQHAAAPGDAGGEMNATFTSVETEKEDDESAVMRELEEMMKSGYKRISDTFREIDQDGNGMLDFGELCAAMSALDVNLTLGQMRSLFDSLDDDDSGGVTCDELEAHIRRWRLSAALASGGRDASGKVRGGAAAGGRGSNKTRLIRRAPGGTTFKPLVVKPAPQVDPKKEKAKAEWARIRAEASLRTGERRGGQLHGHSGDRHGKARERKAKCLWDGSGEAGLDDKMTARLVRTLERQRVDAAKMRMARRLEEARAAAALATHAVTFQNERPGGGGGGGGDHGQREVPETTGGGGGGGQGNDDGDSDGDGDLTVSPVRRTSSMPLRDPPTGRSSVTSASGSSSSNTGLLSRNSPFGRQSSMHGLTATAAASAAAASPSTRPPPPSSAHTMAVLAKASSAPTLLAKHTGTWGPYGTSSDGRAQGLPAWSCCMQDQEDAPGCVPCGAPPPAVSASAPLLPSALVSSSSSSSFFGGSTKMPPPTPQQQTRITEAGTRRSGKPRPQSAGPASYGRSSHWQQQQQQQQQRQRQRQPQKKHLIRPGSAGVLWTDVRNISERTRCARMSRVESRDGARLKRKALKRMLSSRPLSATSSRATLRHHHHQQQQQQHHSHSHQQMSSLKRSDSSGSINSSSMPSVRTRRTRPDWKPIGSRETLVKL